MSLEPNNHSTGLPGALAGLAGYTRTMSLVSGRQVRAGLAVLVLLLLGAPAVAAPKCSASAQNSQSYYRAMRIVQRLPELRAWSRAHGFPVAYGEFVDKQVLLAGRCYWSVTVYADRSERFELWHVFYVAVAGKRVLIDDVEPGEPIPLETWHKARGGA